MKSVFVVQHVHVIGPGSDDVKMIGVYRSKEAAVLAAGRLADQPGFADDPSIIHEGVGDEPGFHINEYELDSDHWVEGYVTV